MLARALAAAALALLISGDVARLGWDAVGIWHFLFPYLWLFVLLETSRAWRRVDDATVFLVGAAMALVYGGVYAKDLQHGVHPFGIDWLSVVCAIFDGGMTTVLALHIACRLVPRIEEEPVEMEVPAVIFLIFCLGAAVAVYGVKTSFNFYRAERMLGPAWLVADMLFVGGAWVLARRAWNGGASAAEEARESWVWGVAAFSIWIPGARFIALWCSAMELSSVLLYIFVGSWTVVALGLLWRVWRKSIFLADSQDGPAAMVLPRVVLAAALWRGAGALLLAVSFGADISDVRASGIFSAAIDWPSRALFAWVFLTSRLRV